MRWVAAVSLMLTAAPLVGAHEYTVHGSIIGPYADQADTGLFALVEEVAPGAIPNGLFYYVVEGVQGGDWYTLTADNQDPFVVGTADECPGPDWDGPLVNALTSGDAEEAARIVSEDLWLLCNNGGDLSIRFTAGGCWDQFDCGCWPGPGCAGTVPGDGDAIVYSDFVEPMVAFTYSEA